MWMMVVMVMVMGRRLWGRRSEEAEEIGGEEEER